MLTKTKVLKTLNRLPDEFSMDELFDQVKVLEIKQSDSSPFSNEKSPSDKVLPKAATHWFG